MCTLTTHRVSPVRREYNKRLYWFILTLATLHSVGELQCVHTPESSLQVQLSVCSEAWAPGLPLLWGHQIAAGFEKHWRWWAENTHLTGCLSSPAGKDPSRSKNSHWASWRGLPWKSKLCSFLPAEQRLGKCLHSAEPCTSGAGGCWLKAQGDETIRAGTLGPCPDLPKLLRRSFSVTWVTAYSFYALVSGSKSSSLHS